MVCIAYFGTQPHTSHIVALEFHNILSLECHQPPFHRGLLESVLHNFWDVEHVRQMADGGGEWG